MIRNIKLTETKYFLLLMGVSLSLVFLYPGIEAAVNDNNQCQSLVFSSIVNPDSLINIDRIAFANGTSIKNTEDTASRQTTQPVAPVLKSGKKTITGQKNSTSLRGAIIDD